VLTDDLERARLIAEAREHVLGFDWAAVAGRTREVNAGMVATDAESTTLRPDGLSRT